MAGVPEEVLQHYAEVDEGGRITSGLRQLEFVRTQRLIERFLPARTLEIADVGGATGVYARWLPRKDIGSISSIRHRHTSRRLAH
jgi:hypothetical protein